MTVRMGRNLETEFEALYHRHYRYVLGYCGRRVPPSDVQDAVADTFLVAWRRFDEIPAGEAQRPWLYGVAYRVIGNKRRSDSRRRRLSERVAGLRAASVESPDVQVVRRVADRGVLEAVGKLSDLDREVILLALWEELTSPEIAGVLNISEAAVRKRTSRARKRLQALLKVPHGVADTTVQETGGFA